jgi:aminoglycoside phosphotransferase (APT) family kinase protein
MVRVSSISGCPLDRRAKTLILELPALLSQLISPRSGEKPLSFIGVRNTKPVFLAFRERSRDPDFVVTVGGEEDVKRLHDVLRRLHRTIPKLTAESLAIARLPNGRFIHLQSAVPGVSLNSLAGSLHLDDCRRLRARAFDVLRELHATIDAVPAWHSRISPSGELRQQLGICSKHDIPLSQRALQFVDSCVEDLAGLGELTCHWQHGDFSTTNLMVAGGDLRIIDFDEFGLTSMPLHDQFGLALSTHELVSADGPWRHLANDIQACLAPVLSAQPALAGHVRGLLVHHLLWNVSQFHSQRSRARRVKAVVKLLEEFAAAPGNYLPPRAS